MVTYPQISFSGRAPRHSELDHGVHVLFFQLVDDLFNGLTHPFFLNLISSMSNLIVAKASTQFLLAIAAFHNIHLTSMLQPLLKDLG
jgi:hypothetical protein